jgi:hypothetical protein
VVLVIVKGPKDELACVSEGKSDINNVTLELPTKNL